jgi:hypothetical protein
LEDEIKTLKTKAVELKRANKKSEALRLMSKIKQLQAALDNTSQNDNSAKDSVSVPSTIGNAPIRTQKQDHVSRAILPIFSSCLFLLLLLRPP